MKQLLLIFVLVCLAASAQAVDYSMGDTTQTFGPYALVGAAYSSRLTSGSTGGTLDSVVIWGDKWYGNGDSVIAFVYNAAGTTLLGRSTGGVQFTTTQDPNTGGVRVKISFAGAGITITPSTAYWGGVHTRSTGSGDHIMLDTLSTNVDSVAIGTASVPLPSTLPTGTTRDKGPGYRRLKAQWFWSSGGAPPAPQSGQYKSSSLLSGSYK